MAEAVRGLDDAALADLAHYLAHFKPLRRPPGGESRPPLEGKAVDGVPAAGRCTSWFINQATYQPFSLFMAACTGASARLKLSNWGSCSRR